MKSDNGDVSYRKAKESDIPFIQELDMDAYAEYLQELGIAWQAEIFKEQLNLNHVQILLSDSTPIGFMSLSDMKDAVLLEDLVLEQGSRGGGIGTKILKKLKEDTWGAGKKLKLRVFKNNIRAKKLYETLGFKLCGEDDTHYSMEWSQ